MHALAHWIMAVGFWVRIQKDGMIDEMDDAVHGDNQPHVFLWHNRIGSNGTKEKAKHILPLIYHRKRMCL